MVKVIRKVFHFQIPPLFFFLFEKKSDIFRFHAAKSIFSNQIAQNGSNWSNLEMTDNYKMSLKKEVAHASYTVGVSNFDLHILWHFFSPYLSSLNFFKIFLPTSNLALRALFLRQHLAKMMQNVDLRFLTARDNFNFKNWCGFSCYADQTFFARAQSHQEGVRPPKVILILFFLKKNCFWCLECKSFICIQIPCKIAWNQGLFHLTETECFKQKI